MCNVFKSYITSMYQWYSMLRLFYTECSFVVVAVTTPTRCPCSLPACCMDRQSVGLFEDFLCLYELNAVPVLLGVAFSCHILCIKRRDVVNNLSHLSWTIYLHKTVGATFHDIFYSKLNDLSFDF